MKNTIVPTFNDYATEVAEFMASRKPDIYDQQAFYFIAAATHWPTTQHCLDAGLSVQECAGEILAKLNRFN